MINDAMFRRNGRAGYVLKPQALREAHKDLLTQRTKHCLKVRVISAQQLPRPRDSQGHEIVDKSVMDPYVEVSLLVPEWTHSPFLPPESDAKYTPASGPQVGGATSARVVSNKTKVVRNNGFNPVWDEWFSLPFDCVGDMKDLVFVKFAVKGDGQDSDEPLAQYVTPLGCLLQGNFLLFFVSQSAGRCKANRLTLDFQVIVTSPCTTRSCPNSCSRPCSFVPKLLTKPDPRLFFLFLSPSSAVDLARLSCCVLKLPSVVLHEIISRFLGLIQQGTPSLVFPPPTFCVDSPLLFVNRYPLIHSPHCIFTTASISWIRGTLPFSLSLSPVSLYLCFLHQFGPRRSRVLL